MGWVVVDGRSGANDAGASAGLVGPAVPVLAVPSHASQDGALGWGLSATRRIHTWAPQMDHLDGVTLYFKVPAVPWKPRRNLEA